MVSRQVITFHPDGTVSGLQRKPGQGIDLRSFGHAEIERASLVDWYADEQAWYIRVLGTKGGAGLVTMDKFHRAMFGNVVTLMNDQTVEWMTSNFGSRWGTLSDGIGSGNLTTDDPLIFKEYDDAVKVEIAYLDALRLKGQF